MTRITAKLLVATYDKKDMLPAPVVSKRASKQSSQATASELHIKPYLRRLRNSPSTSLGK